MLAGITFLSFISLLTFPFQTCYCIPQTSGTKTPSQPRNGAEAQAPPLISQLSVGTAPHTRGQAPGQHKHTHTEQGHALLCLPTPALARPLSGSCQAHALLTALGRSAPGRARRQGAGGRAAGTHPLFGAGVRPQVGQADGGQRAQQLQGPGRAAPAHGRSRQGRTALGGSAVKRAARAFAAVSRRRCSSGAGAGNCDGAAKGARCVSCSSTRPFIALLNISRVFPSRVFKTVRLRVNATGRRCSEPWRCRFTPGVSIGTIQRQALEISITAGKWRLCWHNPAISQASHGLTPPALGSGRELEG